MWRNPCLSDRLDDVSFLLEIGGLLLYYVMFSQHTVGEADGLQLN